jgi:hypothetical protein
MKMLAGGLMVHFSAFSTAACSRPPALRVGFLPHYRHIVTVSCGMKKLRTPPSEDE